MPFPAFKMRLLLVVCLAAALGGCGSSSWFSKDSKADYKVSGSVGTLEVPPDLTKPSRDDTMAIPDSSPSGTATYSAYASERKGEPVVSGEPEVLPDQPDVRVERDGDNYWLVVQGEPAQVWSKVRDFWLKNGFLLTLDNPTIGIMETGWAENRADIPNGPIHSVLSKALGSLYSADTRDKFRVRLEHGTKPGTTEVYLTQKGVEEVVQGDTPDSPEGTMWKPRPEDHELEVEMLKRLMVYLGVKDQRAKQALAEAQIERKPAVHMVTAANGDISLVLDEPFSRAWRVTGLALDRVNFDVQDRNRARGIYFVRYQDPDQQAQKKGFLSKLAFWRSDHKKPQDQYQVYVKSEGESTRILVRDKDGKPDASGTGKRILGLLQEQLK